MVEFKNVSLVLGENEILKDVSFNLEEGHIILLSGNSGEGKSTILKLILGLLQPTSGSIYVFAKNLNNLRTKELMKIRQQCGIVFQNGALFDSLNVEENVSFFLREALHVEREEAHKRVLEILDYLGLKNYLNYYPAQLSGGMKKRVAIARAIVTHPKLLLYDEPTAGLDALTAFRVVDLIRDLQKQLNVTSLIVSHELHYFARTIDKSIHLENGYITSEENNEKLAALHEKMFLDHFIRSDN
jgi:phospholipid/cholesterol/gamma-HCH transport system ATP-binding protein